jgi:hypothetical protein
MKKTKIKAELLVASKNAATGDILYTFLLTYPRYILAEVNTHRMISRNTSSSRAVPSKKYRGNVLKDPFIPTYIGANKKGMQAGEELRGWRRRAAEKVIGAARYAMVATAWGLEKLGVHKQIANRYLEPWVWTQQVLSATELENFFRLRDHHMAEPHFQELARQMAAEVNFGKLWFEILEESGNPYQYVEGFSQYRVIKPGQWHLPFITDEEQSSLDLETLKKISTARCARTSYYLPESGSRSTVERDVELFERLAVREPGNDDPVHLSPLEHVAQATSDSVYVGNFKGFKQYRKHVLGEDGVTHNSDPVRTGA